MNSVKDMSLKEAAGTAIAILLGDPNRKYKHTGEDWQAELKAEWEVEDFSELSDASGAWREAKYESSEDIFDQLTAKVVSEYGGEGQGDQYWMVVSLSDGDTTRYFRKDGYYSSYGESDLDGTTYEVQPTERVVVFYE